MLRTFGPGCSGEIIDATENAVAAGTTWADLEEPSRGEDRLVEEWLGADIPTHDDLKEIEPSSRLYEKDGALYMTLSTLTGVTEDDPVTTPIGFILNGNRLATLRYMTPKPVEAFMQHVRREPDLAADALTALIRLVDSLIDRLADELEEAAAVIEDISSRIFARQVEVRRIPAERLTTLLTRIGRGQTLISKIRYSAVSTSRLLTFLEASRRLQSKGADEHRAHVHSLIVDVQALSEHASFLSDNLVFLLDASLGLISIEQNAAMKLFSWAAVVFLPPTLIAGIYGMNFHNFPELDWHYGYYIALGLMLASAVLPYWFFKRRGWI